MTPEELAQLARADATGVPPAAPEQETPVVAIAKAMATGDAETPHPVVHAAKALAMGDDIVAAKKFEEPEEISPAQFAVRNTIGLPVKALGLVGKGLGAAGSALEKGYKFLVEPPGKQTQVGQTVADAPKTAIEKLFQLEQIPENLLKKGTAAILGDPQSGYGRSFADIFTKNPSAVLSFLAGMKVPEGAGTGPAAQEALANSGVIADVAADPFWFLKPLGLTKAGVVAQKAGMLEPNVGAAMKAGQRALLSTAGGKPIIQSPKVAEALKNASEALFNKAQTAGYTRMTQDAGFNRLAEDRKISPMSHASVLADEAIGNPLKDMIERNAKEMGITPEELQVRMAEWREPAGSQMPLSFTDDEYAKKLADFQALEKDYKAAFKEKTPDPAKLQKMKDLLDQSGSELSAMEHESAMKRGQISNQKGSLMAQFPPEIQEELGNQEKRNLEMGQVEGQAMRPDYLHHISTPEWEKFKRDTFNKANKGPSVGQRPGSEFNPADMDRILSNYSKNEVNNLAAEGKLGSIMPRFQEQFNNFRGKVFDDDIARIEAARYLNHRSVMTSKDLMREAGKTYGKSTKALEEIVGGKPGAMKDWVEVSSPEYADFGGTMWFPKQIGNFLNGVGRVEKNPGAFLNASNRIIKFFNYGAFPKSALKNYGSNLELAAMNGMFNPLNPRDVARYPKAAMLVARSNPTNRILNLFKLDRSKVSPLGNDVVVHSPIYGDITSKQLMDMAHAHRGIGMGPARSFVAQGMRDEGWLQKPIPAGLYDLHNLAEDASRLPVFMKALEDGYTWEGAGEASRKSLYDYSNMGERDAKWAMYVPFYRFARLNLPNVMSQMVQNPARTLFPENLRESYNKRKGRDDEDLMNRWQKEAGPIHTFTDEAGNPHYGMMQTVFPQYDINRFFGTTEPGENPIVSTAKSMAEYGASSLNPLIKAPVEAVANYNFDYKKPIDRNLAAGLSEPEKVPTWAGPMDAKAAFLLRQFRPFSEAQQLANTNASLTPAERILRSTLGLNSQPLDVEKSTIYKLIDRKKNILETKHLLSLYVRKLAAAEATGDTQARDAALLNIQALQKAIQGGGVDGGGVGQ